MENENCKIKEDFSDVSALKNKRKQVNIDGLLFSSEFDSGNSGHVLKDESGRYCIWPALDCAGTPYEKRSCTWWYFTVAGGIPNQSIQLVIMNVGRTLGLFKSGMRPVLKVTPFSNEWSRMKTPVVCEEIENPNGKTCSVQFSFEFPGIRKHAPSPAPISTRISGSSFRKRTDQKVQRGSIDTDNSSTTSEATIQKYREVVVAHFAFCFPYSYEDGQAELLQLEEEYGFSKHLQPEEIAAERKRLNNIYFYREHLTNSIEGRRIDLLTITDFDGIDPNHLEDHFSNNSSVFPERDSPRPHRFHGKTAVFVSARVHPGETPGQFAFLGMLRFLLDKEDPRARVLRRRFLFKMVPMLNPDGVAHGHTRHDTLGQNLNRFYTAPTSEKQPAIFAVKELVHQLHANNSLKYYIDCHAHSSKRGCFVYGNQLDSINQQVENQLIALLMSINTQHFEYESCLFSKEHMFRVETLDEGMSAEGTGRVGFNLQLGLIHSYTLECNFNSDRRLNDLAPMQKCKAVPAPISLFPPRYTPEHWRDVGRSFLFAILDLEGENPMSRLGNSKLRTLKRARQEISAYLWKLPFYKDPSLAISEQRPVCSEHKEGGKDGPLFSVSPVLNTLPGSRKEYTRLTHNDIQRMRVLQIDENKKAKMIGISQSLDHSDQSADTIPKRGRRRNSGNAGVQPTKQKP